MASVKAENPIFFWHTQSNIFSTHVYIVEVSRQEVGFGISASENLALFARARPLFVTPTVFMPDVKCPDRKGLLSEKGGVFDR